MVSTDCFSAELLCGFADRGIETVKTTPREAIPQILQGGANYYLHTDFSPSSGSIYDTNPAAANEIERILLSL